MCYGVVVHVGVGRWVEVLGVKVLSEGCLRPVRVSVGESSAPTYARSELVEAPPKPAITFAADGPAQ